MSKSAYELVKKRADLAISDLTAQSGILQPMQANRFIDMILEEPTILKQARLERMTAPKMIINRMGFGSRVLRAARTVGGQLDAGGNDRYLRAADRAKPDFGSLELNSHEVMAEVRINYETLEDNLERGGFEEHLMRSLAARVAVDLEEWALWADTASADPYLALTDGWMKRANAHVLDNDGAGLTPDVFAMAQKTLPQKYARLLPQMRGFISVHNLISYQQAVARRISGYGDSTVQNGGAKVAFGLQLESAPMLAAQGSGQQGLVTVPQNLIWGIRRDISIETARDIRSREIIIVVTARVGTQIDEVDAVVRLDDLGGLAPVNPIHVIVDNAADFPV